LFAEVVNVAVRAVGNGKVRVNVGDEQGSYQTETTRQCEVGAEIQVEIESMENFIGWGGFGDASQRSITSRKTITVGSSDMTITAYFLNNIKDNIILNGDLEINNNSAHNAQVDKNLGRLIAGTWKIINNMSATTYMSGINVANNGKQACNFTNTRAYTTGGISFQLATDVTGDKVSSWECEVNVPCAGYYAFSLVFARCSNNQNIGNNYFKLKVELVDNTGRSIQAGLFDVSGKSTTWLGPYTSDEFKLPKSGVYTLKLSIPIESRYNASKRYLIMCMDDLELKLTKQLGFFIKVR
jgi:hypothetical protein